jgi:hypothetical protein
MNLKKIVSRYASFFLLAIICQARAIWEYYIFPDVRVFLVGSLVALMFLVLPFLLEAASVWLEGLLERKKIIGSAFVVLLVVFVVAGFWRQHSRIWAVLNALLGLFFMLVIWKDRLFPNIEERRQARRARAEKLLADRAAFEKSWQRRIKTTEGILVLFCALLAFLFWLSFFKYLAVVPGLLAVLFFVGLFARLTPMSDEKFEKHLAKAKARHEHIEARRAYYANRRAERAQRMEELKKRPKPSNPMADSLSSFVYWSVMACVFWLPNRSTWERPDLAFLAMPAWYLIRTIYFFIRKQNPPEGPDTPLMPDTSTATR